MKKKFLTYGKKSLSVFLAVLMLMTCWVFVAPEHNEVSAAEAVNATASYNNSVINGITDKNFSTALNTVYGKFTIDVSAGVENSYSDTQKATVYKNVIYSPIVTNNTSSDPSAVRWNVTLYAGDSWIRYFYPNTVLVDDGTTDPSLPIVMSLSTNRSYITPYSGWIADSSTCGMYMMNTYWKGIGSSSNVEAPQFLQAYFAGGVNAITTDGVRNDTYRYRHSGGTSKAYFWTNALQFKGSVSESTYYNAIKPDFRWYGANDYTSGLKTLTVSGENPSADGKVNKTIYVLKYDTLKTAIGQAKTIYNNIISNPGRYTTASVKKYVELANALLAARPGNYITSSTAESSLATQVAAYGTAAKNAVTAWNTWYNAGDLSDRTFELTYENMFSLSDWWNSSSSRVDDAYVTTNLSSGTLSIYKPYGEAEYTTDSSYPSVHADNMYSIPVTGGEDYTVEFTTSTSSAQGTTNSEVFLFWYDINNNPVTQVGGTNTFNNKGFTNDGRHTVTFTVPDTATKAEIRFDNDGESYSTVAFSKIAVYPKDRADEIELELWSSRDYRKLYYYGNAFSLSGLTTPVRPGYQFDGWYLDAEYTTPYSDYDGWYTFTTENGAASFPAYAKWTKKTLDIGYDNLFSVSDWADTGSPVAAGSGSADGTVEYDVEKGTITIETNSTLTNPEVYTNYSGAGDTYRVAVEPNTEYIFETNMTLEKGTKGQMFVFLYDANGNGVNGAVYNGSVQNNPHIGIYPTVAGENSIVFTTPADCTQIGFRVGATSTGTRATYSNIGVYKKADYDAYAKNYAKVREPFKVGDTTAFMIPTRDGWAFDGWYTADGTKIENVTGLYESDTVYAQWIKLHTVTFKNYDGTVLKTEKLKSGSATAPANPIRRPDANYEYTFAGWDKDFSNVTGDITVTAQYNEVEHSGVKVVLNTPATCTTPGLVTKSCSCGYVWSGIIEDDTGTYPALGHEYDTAKGAKVAGGTSTGVDGVHSVQCARYDVCGSTTTAAHNFQLDANQSASDATCVKPGETYYICACNEKKTETGTINPDNHVNTEIRDAKDATCLDDGYTGDTWCKDCGEKIKDGTEIAKLGHSFTKYVYNEGTAKCEVDGTETAKCDRCDVTETRTSTGTALQHNWENKEDYLKSAANCTDDEVYYKKCSLCGISSETKTGETWTKTGTKWNHNFSGDYVTNNNGTHVQKCINEDCTATGNQQNCDYNAWTTDNASTHSHTCKNCSYTPAATAHEWSDWSQASTNTGDAAGQMTRSCTVCGRVETENCEYDSVHTEATCTTAGYTTYTCKDANCKHAYTVWHKDTEPAKGHNYTGEYNCDEATDKHQQLCANGCGTYGVDGVADAWAECTFTYENTEAGKHTAACVCDNSEVQDCTGGTATCVDLAVCEKCGEEYGTLADHVYTGKNYVEKATDATCTANETYYYDCIICNKSGKEANSGTYEKPDSMLPHTYTGNTWYDGAELAEEAKCEENEEYYVYCIDCKKSSKGTDEEETFEKDGTATDHKWGALVSGENGTHSYTCQNEGCTEIKTENCADWKMQSGVAPSTCLDKGYTVYECEVCAYNWKDNYTDALGHSYTGEGHDGKPVRVLSEEYKRSVKTCTEPETYWYRCDRCDVSAETGATYTDETESNYYWSNGSAAGHDMQKLVDTNDLSKNRKSEATCTQAAVYYYSCATCGEQDTTQTFTYMSALSHDWKEVEDAKYLATPADCVNDATYYYECSRCTESGKDITGATWTKANSKSGHDFDHEDGYKAAVGATCTTDGNLEYWHCEVCDKYFSDKDATKEIEDVVIDHLGHDWEAVAYKAPTCEEAGYSNHNACSRCDATMNKTEYAATGHKFTGAYWCDTVYNYHSKKCTNDDCTATGIVDAEGNHIKYEVIYDIDVEIKGGEACIFTGEYVYETDENGIHSHALKCVCGNETSEVCVDSEPETVAPTCTEDGYTEYTCETCGYVWQVAGDPAKDHDYTDAEWTSNGDGTHSRACKNGCGEVQTEDCATDTPATTCGGKNVCDTCEEEFGNAIPHSFTNYVYDEDSATCTVDGTKTAVCDYCGEAKDTITAEGTATDHNMTLYIYDVSEWDGMPENFDKDSIKEPTCKNEGRSISFCQNKGCDEHKIRVVAADKTKHIWETDENGEEKWTVVSGDCGTGVTFKCICTACGDSKTKIETVEHQWETQLYIPPTCVNNGCEELKCTVCGFEKDVYYPEDESLGATGDHVYGEAVVVAPTCTAKGYTIEICKVCRYENITNETDVIAHVTETVEALAPSCETAGYYSYEKCTVCKTEIDKKVIPATGHNDDGEGKCSECDRVLYETDDGEGSCGCICHKEGWFMKLIYKVINFFWKLFRISKSCDCGNVHW